MISMDMELKVTYIATGSDTLKNLRITSSADMSVGMYGIGLVQFLIVIRNRIDWQPKL